MHIHWFDFVFIRFRERKHLAWLKLKNRKVWIDFILPKRINWRSCWSVPVNYNYVQLSINKFQFWNNIAVKIFQSITKLRFVSIAFKLSMQKICRRQLLEWFVIVKQINNSNIRVSLTNFRHWSNKQWLMKTIAMPCRALCLQFGLKLRVFYWDNCYHRRVWIFFRLSGWQRVKWNSMEPKLKACWISEVF